MKFSKKSGFKHSFGKEPGLRYIFWLFVSVIIISVISLFSSVFASQSNSSINKFADSLRNTKTVYFDYGKYDLKEDALTVLNEIAADINLSDSIKITGHTDNSGTEEFNYILSKKRAEAVMDYLISKGVNSGQIEIYAEGYFKPVTDNLTEEKMALNRRVEIKIFFIKPVVTEPDETYINASFFKSSRDTLNFNLTARDSALNPVTGLNEDDIKAVLKWNTGEKNDSVQGKSRLIPIDENKKIAFTFTMDYSPSMYDNNFDMESPKSESVLNMEHAVHSFISKMDSRHFAKIIKFGKVINVIQGFTKSKELMLNAVLNQSFPRPGTALFNSIYTALADSRYDDNPSIIKTVIAFTDGEENSSEYITKDSVLNLSVRRCIKVFTVGLRPQLRAGDRQENIKRAEYDLKQIARTSGGFYYTAVDPKLLESIYAAIYDQIMKSYQLSIIWDKTGLPPKGTRVTAVLRINLNGRVRTVHKTYIME